MESAANSLKNSPSEEAKSFSSQTGPEDVKIEIRKTKTHGLSCPWHWQQVLSFVYYSSNIVVLFYVILPILAFNHAYLYLPLALAFLSLLSCVLFFTFKATMCDPTDPIIYKERECNARDQMFDATGYKLFCDVCETSVSDRAKHCGVCNRCVD
jgi:hypothetical protein